MSDSVIPIINLVKFSDADAAERARVVAEVRKALEEVGFLMIAGHGIDQSLIDRVTEASLAFFDRPEDEKLKFASSKPGARGYNRMRGRTVGKSHDASYLASLQESYGIG
ncbi:MAG TPA: 2-oxoglutarate and iron-dependent oxygenase domain-containing protein, partial [Beijerinckiaceae bacterium]|nr:2-oxoglutarate and iron-dependent oxygenase domain-containing protein [Beijerinckiaceae bacterium]